MGEDGKVNYHPAFKDVKRNWDADIEKDKKENVGLPGTFVSLVALKKRRFWQVGLAVFLGAYVTLRQLVSPNIWLLAVVMGAFIIWLSVGFVREYKMQSVLNGLLEKQFVRGKK